MKKSVIGYIEPKKVVEVVAAVEPKELELFFDSIKEYNFEDGYTLTQEDKNIKNGNLEIEYDIKRSTITLEEYNLIKSSDDLINALKEISTQEVINFEPLTKLLESNSKLNNPLTTSVLNKFIDLYKYEKKNIIEPKQFKSIQKAMQAFGDEKDNMNFNSLVGSLCNNTKFLGKLGKHTLLKRKSNSMSSFMSIDKTLVR